VSPVELIDIAIGCTLVALGVTSVGAWGLRRRGAEPLPLLFGIWCVMYGFRLIARVPMARLALGGGEGAWAGAIAFTTYCINVPSALFFEALIGRGWQSSVRRVRQVQLGYAVAAILAGLATGNVHSAMRFNNPIVIGGLAVQVVNGWLYRDRITRLFRTPIIAAAGGVLLIAVINENLGRPFLPSVNLETVGVLVLVLALGQGVVSTVIRGEAELLAVQRELDTARQIQRSLLPRELPHVRGLDVAVQFVPMSAVAGDLYDFADLGTTKVGILIADVSGHGIPAALVASMVKLAFSLEAEHADDPARVLSSMNRALCRQLEGTFVTAIYVVIDTERSTITAANAGHPPPLVGSATRGVVDIREHGLMLGFAPEASYRNTEIALENGDLILLYSDGLTDAQNRQGEFFDRERVDRWLTSATSGNVTRLGAEALSDLRRWRGDVVFEDDVTFVIAQFTRLVMTNDSIATARRHGTVLGAAPETL
jgi:phosphoserine phosphatase RsbU/P